MPNVDIIFNQLGGACSIVSNGVYTADASKSTKDEIEAADFMKDKGNAILRNGAVVFIKGKTDADGGVYIVKDAKLSQLHPGA